MRKYILILIIALSGGISVSLQAQGITITGRITDNSDTTMPGVTIREKDTQNGTMSDPDGNYSITVKSQKSILIFSFMGFATQEVAVNNKTSLNIVMDEESIDMEEVVVVGYGSQKKASVVGAISSANVEDMQKTGTTNLTQALGGRIAGVITRTPGGRPGEDDAHVLIRGRATYNSGGSSPLVLVDGVEREYSQIDPEDIESFNVLKDASATAVFGVRGANGVILITTKRGQTAKPSINFKSTFSANSPIRLPERLGSYDFARLKNEALNNVGLVPEYSSYDLDMYRTHESPYTHPDNDYVEDMLKDFTYKQQYNLTVRGGTPFVHYYVSANYLSEDGIYKTFDNDQYDTNVFFKRYGVRTNLDFNITKSTNLGVDIGGRLEERHNNGYGEELFYSLVRTPPNHFNYINPNGSLGGNLNLINPYAALSRYGYDHSKRNVFEAVIKLNQKFDFVTPGLSLRGMFGFVSSMRSRRDLREKPELWKYTKQGEYEMIQERVDITINTSAGPHTRNFTTEFAANYERKFGDHAVTGLLAFNRLQTFNNANLPGGYLNYVGRATYAYMGKYLAEINAGYNGSMQFSKKKRFGLFPAFSAGWVVSEEKFWNKESKTFEYLKIRGAYGEVGNDRIGANKYLYLQTYPMLTSNRPTFGTTNAPGVNRIFEGTEGNNLVGWERARKLNLGFDSKFFNHKLSFSFDVFHERRTNILDYDRYLPTLYGMLGAADSNKGTPPQNLGEVVNRGFDAEINYEFKINKVKLYANANGSFARNKIKKYGEDALVYPWMTRIDKPIEQRYGLICDGFYNTQEEIDALPSSFSNNLKLGDLKYRDINGDGVIDSYDVYPIGGTKMPDFMYGLTIGGEWNGFDFQIFFQGATGADIYANGAGYWEFTNTGSVMKHHLGRWTPDNMENATYPSLSPMTSEQNHRLSTFWLKSGDYLRLKNLQIGYTLPRKLMSKLGVSSLRVFASGTNLLTFTKFKEYDPESDDGDGTKYPQMILINGGFSLNF